MPFPCECYARPMASTSSPRPRASTPSAAQPPRARSSNSPQKRPAVHHPGQNPKRQKRLRAASRPQRAEADTAVSGAARRGKGRHAGVYDGGAAGDKIATSQLVSDFDPPLFHLSDAVFQHVVIEAIPKSLGLPILPVGGRFKDFYSPSVVHGTTPRLGS